MYNQETLFIGHYGIGSSVELLYQEHLVILRETHRSQIWIIFLLSWISLYPLWLLLEMRHLLKGGVYAQVILAITVIVSIPFLIKFIRRLLSRRRVELNLISKTVRFYQSKKKFEKELLFSKINKIKFNDFEITLDQVKVHNFSISLIDDNFVEYLLCVSNEKDVLLNIYNKLKSLIE